MLDFLARLGVSVHGTAVVGVDNQGVLVIPVFSIGSGLLEYSSVI